MLNLDETYGEREAVFQMGEMEEGGGEEELEENKIELTEYKSNKREKKRVRFTQVDDVIDTFRHFAKLGNKQKVDYFKSRKPNNAAYNYKRYKKFKRSKVHKEYEKNDKLLRAELEMATIASLREMYFNSSKTLKTFEEINMEKEQTGKKAQAKMSEEAELPQRVFKSYLDKYQQKQLDELFVRIPRKGSMESMGQKNNEKYADRKRSRDAIRNGKVVTVFNVDDDNLFTDDELFRIEKMKRNVHLLKKPNEKANDMHSKEVWEWDELVKKFPNFSATEDDSTITESSNKAEKVKEKPMAKLEIEQFMKNYLINWFQREFPTERNECKFNGFKFYENLYKKRCTFLYDTSILSATIKFLKLAKIAFPDLECTKVLKEVQSYTGPITLDDIEVRDMSTRPILKMSKKKLGYFRKLLMETKELESLFVSKEIKTEVKDDLEERTNRPKLLNYTMGDLYYDYVESYLPCPFNEIFISIANGFTKYIACINNDPEVKTYKKEITELVTVLLKLILDTIKSVVDTSFRSNARCDFPEEKVSEEERSKTVTNDDEKGTDPQRSGKELDCTIKKLMVHFMKFMNIKKSVAEERG